MHLNTDALELEPLMLFHTYTTHTRAVWWTNMLSLLFRPGAALGLPV